MPRHHPLVKAYLDGRIFLGELAEIARAESDPVSCAAMDVWDAVSGRRAIRPVLESLRAVPASAWDSETFLILFLPWIVLCLEEGLTEEALALMRRAQSCLSGDTPAPLRSRVLLADSPLRRGNVPDVERSLRDALELLPADTPHRCYVLIQLARLLGCVGRLDEIEPEIARSRALRAPRFLSTIVYARFIQAVETGRTDEARRMHEGFATGPRPTPEEDVIVAQWLQVADFIDGIPVASAEPWAEVHRLLAAGRPQEALDAARREQSGRPDPLAEDCTGFCGLRLLRAELACGHEQAAARILESRARHRNLSFLDPFFAARLHRLGGRWTEAEAAFAEATAACERHGAMRRLEFEIRIACELNREDVFRLARGPRLARPRRASPAAGTGSAGLARILGSSPATAQLRDHVRRFASLDAPVLITGETGTGKDLVARALHEESPRASEPFVAVNCAAISDSLLESELFGHEKGAFTGASQVHAGLFEQAGEGTLFLDEIGDVSPRLQAALLRVLETGEYRRVGGDRGRRSRCRILAATNADLPALAAAERFREDLIFRLRRLELQIPPLRERRDDIVPLALHFLAEGRTDGQEPRLRPELERDLVKRNWPGNVRELRHAMERMRLLNSEALEYGTEESGGAKEVLPAPAVAAPHAAAPDFRPGNHPLRRRERIAKLFREHGRLTRSEVIAAVSASPNTVSGDLLALASEGLIERVEPTGSTRTHYFRLREAEVEDHRT